MEFADFIRAVFALALTLGLVGMAAVALRRFGPDALARFSPTRKERRLAIVESLVLDPSRGWWWSPSTARSACCCWARARC